MPTDSSTRSKRVLEPSERIAEVLFGLIMALTFTGSLSIAEAGRDDVRAMLIGALGCNIAWGIIDGILYLMGCLAEKGRNLRTYLAIRGATNPAEARRLMGEVLPKVIASIIEPAQLDRVYQKLQALPDPPERARLDASDWRGALGVFLLVFVSTLPVALPFVIVHNTLTAMRVSNAIAVSMLFVAGVGYGRVVGGRPWVFGLSMVALGGSLVALTIALGG